MLAMYWWIRCNTAEVDAPNGADQFFGRELLLAQDLLIGFGREQADKSGDHDGSWQFWIELAGSFAILNDGGDLCCAPIEVVTERALLLKQAGAHVRAVRERQKEAGA